MDVLNNIYYIRTKQGLSLRDLADLSGLNYSTINKIENGMRSPTQVSMLLLSKALNTPTHEVFMLDYTKINL